MARAELSLHHSELIEAVLNRDTVGSRQSHHPKCLYSCSITNTSQRRTSTIKGKTRDDWLYANNNKSDTKALAQLGSDISLCPLG